MDGFEATQIMSSILIMVREHFLIAKSRKLYVIDLYPLSTLTILHYFENIIILNIFEHYLLILICPIVLYIVLYSNRGRGRRNLNKFLASYFLSSNL